MTDIDDRLGAAPGEASPRGDLWPAISARMRGRRRWSGAVRAAAVIAIFFTGGAAGATVATMWLRSGQTPDAISTAAAPPLETAIEIQRSGSAYLAALGRLRHVEPDEAGARSQGYEAALAVLAAAAAEVAVAADLPAGTGPLTESAEQVRSAAAARVTSLTTGAIE